jgi:hypothetical protein
MTMQPEYLKVGDLLGSRVPFVIPRYQRGYAWEKEDIKNFTRDLRALVSAPPGSNHFFGGIVSVNYITAGTARGGVNEVIDGQQRISTFLLAFRAVERGYEAIADEASAAGDEGSANTARAEARVLHNDLMWYDEVEGGARVQRPRLRLSRDDDPVFLALLRGEPPACTRHSHHLLDRAAKGLFRDLVESDIMGDDSLTPDAKLDRLKQVAAALANRTDVIHIRTDKKEEAYHLFAVLNDRGRSLSDADLLRTRTLELLEQQPDMLARVEEQWTSILRSKPAEVRAFLQAYYGSRLGIRAPSKGLFDAYRERFDFLKGDGAVTPERATRVAELVANMSKEAALFALLRRGEWPFADTRIAAWERDRLRRLVSVLEHKASIPLLMSLVHSSSEVVFRNAVLLLERFAFRYALTGGHAGQLGDRYLQEAKRIRAAENPDSLEGLVGILRDQLRRYSTDPVFRAALNDRVRYGVMASQQLRHFLTTLDDATVSDEEGSPAVRFNLTHTFDLTGIHVEHVYPRSAPAGQRDAALEPLKEYLGNLTFWPGEDNVAAGNEPFAEKRRKYATSRILMTSELAELPQWRKEELEARQAKLVAKALAVWAPPGGPLDIGAPEAREQAWMVQQFAGAPYDDVEGRAYEYPEDIPNGGQIREGDYLICYLPKRLASDGNRIFGVGKVGAVVARGDSIVAQFSGYSAIDPPLGFTVLGGDPRANRRNSINAVSGELLDRLLRASGIGTRGALPEVDIPVAALDPSDDQDSDSGEAD